MADGAPESPRMTLRPAATLSGDEADATATAAVPERLEPPGFAVEAEIGRGGMGIVYRATQEGLERPVALKALRPELEGGPAAEKFAAEARITGRLDHPGIPPVHLFGRDESGRAFLALKLVKGIAWSDLLDPRTDETRARAKAMDRREHLEILRRVCEAVAFAHTRGVIHRDLKPENVMVGEFGEVLVMDWGIAFDRATSTSTSTSTNDLLRPIGTPAYMPPEMATRRDAELGPATDVYLLGGILYEILCGKPPHPGESVTAALLLARDGSVEPPAGAPPPLAEIAMRALDPDPKKRYASPMDLAAAIDEYWRLEAAMALADHGLAELEAAEAARAAGGKAGELYARFAGASAALEQAAAQRPENRTIAERLARARVSFAGCALENGDLALAEEQLAHAGEGAPGAAEARARLAELRARRAASEVRRRRLVVGLGVAGIAILAVAALALRASRRVGELEAAHQRRLAAQAEIDSASWSEPESVLAATERAIAIDPTWAEGLAQLARAYMRVGEGDYASRTDPEKFVANFERACGALDRALAISPDAPLMLSDRGYTAAMLGDWHAARGFYRRCAAADPAGHSGREAAGLVALDEGRFADAAEHFTACIRIAVQEMDYFNRAAARYAGGDVDGALRDAHELERLRPGGDEWYVALQALLHLAHGEVREAGELIAAGLDKDPEGSHLLPLLAYRAALLGDRERAAAVLERARFSHRKYARAFLSLEPFWTTFARAPGPLGRPGRAVVLDIDFDAIAPREPASSVRLRREAERALAQGDRDGAIAAASRALADDPADGGAYFVRGKAYIALGHLEAARRELGLAATLAPEHAAAATAALETMNAKGE